MRVWIVFLLAAPLLLAPPALEGQRAGAPKLGVDGLVHSRGEGTVAVLARATASWQGVSTRSEELRGDFRYLPDFATARSRGQVFEVLESDAPEWLSGGQGRFVAVPWSFGPGCAEEGWQNPTWVSPGDTVAFLLLPTRTRSRDGQGLHVFDVLGWHQPYPVGDLIPFWRKGPDPNLVWLSPSEFYELLTVLPMEVALQADPAGALSRAMAWVEREPDRRLAFPLPEILEAWENALRVGG
jgi:hypothetical protein